MFSQIVVLIRLILVMSATNATNDRCFSALLIVFTNHYDSRKTKSSHDLACVHRVETDALDIHAIASDVMKIELRSLDDTKTSYFLFTYIDNGVQYSTVKMSDLN